MLILGLDPGTATTGYGLIKTNNKNFEVVEWGLIETDKESDPGKRLINIYKKMKDVLNEHSPNVVAIEKLFFATNAKTAMRVGQAHGVLLFCAAEFKLNVHEYAPGTIKKMVSGNGRADKKFMQKSLRKILGAGVRSKPRQKTHFDNAADALAVAVCHVLKINGTQKGGD